MTDAHDEPCRYCEVEVNDDDLCGDCWDEYGEVRHMDCCEKEQGW